MDKAELLQNIIKEGSENNFRGTPAWSKAFEEFRRVHHKKLMLGCHSCHRDVLQWLRS